MAKKRGRPAGRQRAIYAAKKIEPKSILFGRLRSLPRWVTIGLVLIAFWAAYFVIDWVLFSPAPMAVQATVSRAGTTRLIYDTAPTQSVSPSCGCAQDDPSHWRGLSFLARRFQISPIESVEPHLTVVTIFSPHPGEFRYAPVQFRLNVTEYSVDIPSHTTLNLFPVISGPPQVQGAINITRTQQGSPHLYTFVVEDVLNIHNLGPVPIGAWIPLRGSSVTLSSANDPYDSSLSRYSIREQFESDPNAVHEPAMVADGVSSGHPALDLIGPVVWGWTRAERIGDVDRYAVVRIEAPFALRFIIEGAVGQPARSMSARHIGGTAELTFAKSLSDMRDFDLARETIAAGRQTLSAEQEITFENALTGETVTEPTFTLVSYPPAPPSDGFNIFGAVSELEMADATGSIMLGSTHIPFQNATLLLSNLTGFQLDSPQTSLPIQMAGDQVTVNSSFGTDGMISINDDTITNGAYAAREYISRIEIMLIIAGLLTPAITIAFWLKEKPKQRWRRTRR